MAWWGHIKPSLSGFICQFFDNSNNKIIQGLIVCFLRKLIWGKCVSFLVLMNKTGKMIYSSRKISTNLQILYRLLSHLRLRIALCPNWSQVGGIKLKVFGACHQVVVKPGSPLSIPKHRLYRLQPPRCSLVVYCSWVTITCQEVTHHRYVTPVRN